jgi:hypothetical protein
LAGRVGGRAVGPGTPDDAQPFSREDAHGKVLVGQPDAMLQYLAPALKLVGRS